MFKVFSIFSPGGHFVYQSESILAIWVGSHLGNIAEKFDSHWPRVKEKIVIKANYSRFSIFGSGDHFVHGSKIVKLF